MKFKSIVLCFSAFLVNNVVCNRLTCRERSYDHKHSCTIDGYSLKLKTADEFELDEVYQKEMIINLKFTNSNVTHIPHGIFTNLEYLQTLDLSDSQVTKVIQTIFTFSYNLNKLILSHNLMTELNDSVFDLAYNLESIDLSHNKIHTIGVNVFKNLNELIQIDLSHNLIKIESSSIFPAYLTTLNLDFNQIIKFVINESTNIEQISLNNNKLRVFYLNSFIKSLQADYNRLESKHLFFNNSNLNSLSLKYNYLTNFNVITYMSNLSYLDLSNNPKNTPPNGFNKLINLKKLILKSVKLEQTDIEWFSELSNLETLDISANNLSYIDFNRISRLENLKYLFLNNNNLNNQTFDELDYLFPNLAAIDVSENNWICTDLVTVLKKLKLLKISIVIDDANLISSGANIRGIQCTNDKKPVLNYEPVLNIKAVDTIKNTEFDQVLNEFRNENDLIETKLREILNKLNDSGCDVQTNRETADQINIIIDQLKQLILKSKTNTTNRQDEDRSANTEHKIDSIRLAILNKIDSSFIELFDIKVYLMAAVQLVAIILIISILYIIYKKCGNQNKDLYNNYNLPTIECSKPKDELLQINV